jgi:hypothetical protein
MSELKGSRTEKTPFDVVRRRIASPQPLQHVRKQGPQGRARSRSRPFSTRPPPRRQEHAKRFFSFLKGGDLEITATFPAGKVGTTLENLEASAMGEEHEWQIDYPRVRPAWRAKRDSRAIAKLWDAVSVAEKQHGKRYRDLFKNLSEGKVFKKRRQGLTLMVDFLQERVGHFFYNRGIADASAQATLTLARLQDELDLLRKL